MADAPNIKYSGQGSAREAARLGQTIADGVAGSLTNHGGPRHIETLRLQLPSGASQRDIERAIRRAIARQTEDFRS